MKLNLFLFLACTGLLTAQDKPHAKGKAALKENILCFVETFTLPKTDYAMLLDAPQGRSKLHENVEAAVKAGTARLDGCHLILTQSGTHSRVEGVDELIYATHWGDADSAGFQYPEAFEMQPLGDHFEAEPVLNEDGGALDLNQFFSRDHFQGLRLSKADTTLTGVPVAQIFQQKGQSNCRLVPGVPTLLATLNEAPPGAITLVFATAQVLELAAPKVPTSKGTGTLRMTTCVISLDRMKGWELLKKHAADGAACLAELKPLLAAKEAVQEHVSTSRTLSGQQVAFESGQIYTYGTERALKLENPSNPPVQGVPAGREPIDLESRTLGFRINQEPKLTEDSALVQMLMTVSCVRMTGNLKDKNWSERYSEQPVFSNQTLSTEYTQVLGGTTLAGTLNPPGDTGVNGHKDEGRIWLLFTDVNPE
ncbi:MAG: hypothetical protein K9N47_20905 [Prosthecobacter sp.]|uniref:hypothetical protein n=1 Tax=Prosthecobacter sp. TaxID=1965333 RepID=UPI00260F0D2E|nr:hypothetical protein [Prosthecobacter sp.]MCF7788595.1 hypothetical protein [Prosthecobacter sp.]